MRSAPILFVLFFFIFLSVFKFVWSVSLPQFDYEDDTGYYFSEAAFHYRYAKMIAFSKPIPVIDYQAQYPEGADVFRQFTLSSEYVYGLPYKLLSIQMYVPFHVYLLFVISFFSSLNIFVIYFVALSLWKNHKSAVFSCVIFSTAIPSFERTIGWYGYEDFAFFFIFMSVVFFIHKQRVAAYLSAILLCVALVGWHLTPFYIVILSVAVLAMYLFHYPNDSFSMKRITLLYLFLFVTGVLFPVLRQKSFITSPGMLIFLSLVITNVIILKFHRVQKKIVFEIFLIILLVLFFFSHTFGSLHSDDFSHIYNLIKAKVLFLGVKPDNPSLIPFETRIYWLGPYNSPTLPAFLQSFLPHILLTGFTVLIILYSGFKKKMRSQPDILLLVFLLVTIVISYTFFIRMRSLLIFFSALFAGGILNFIPSRNSRKKLMMVIPVVLIFGYHIYIFSQNLPDFKFLKPSVFKQKEANITKNQQLAVWVKKTIPPKSVFLTPDIGLGSFLLAYADVSVVLHSQFEEKTYRNKYQEILIALFGDQQQFYQTVKKYGVDFFILSPTIVIASDKDSLRYAAENWYKMNENSFPFQYYQKHTQSPYFTFVVNKGDYDVFKVEK